MLLGRIVSSCCPLHRDISFAIQTVAVLHVTCVVKHPDCTTPIAEATLAALKSTTSLASFAPDAQPMSGLLSLSWLALQDAYLPQRLVDKLMYMYNYIEMARVTGVPMSFLLTRGQSIKVFSQILRKARQRNLLVPFLKVCSCLSSTMVASCLCMSKAA